MKYIHYLLFFLVIFTETFAIDPSSLAVSQGESVEHLRKHIHYSKEGPNRVGLITINDRTSGINQSTWLYVKSALDYYKKTKPSFVILELNTPGGEVFPAQEISDALKELDTQYNVPVVAFINNWAISAGAMLAYSTRFIAVVKDGSMGAAEPVTAGEGGEMKSASEKVNSALRTDFANRAHFFDRNPDIAEAMVDKDIILVLRDGKVLRLDREDQIRTTGPHPDVMISSKGKLLTLNASQLVEYGVADIYLPPEQLVPITDAELADGQWPFSKMLLSENAFFKEIPNVIIDEYQMDWKTRFFAFLATPMVSSILLMGLLVGGYMEFSSPGATLPGSVALISLFLIVISSMAFEIANWLELILLLSGVGLIALEALVFPTAGLLGIAGGLFFVMGLFGMFLPGISTISFELKTASLNAAGYFFLERLAWLCGVFVLAAVIMGILSRYVTPSWAGVSRLVLSGHEQESSRGYIAGDDPLALPRVGSLGIVMAVLRPAGKVIIDNKIYDAVTRGDYIDKGEAITVSKLDGSVLVVKRVERGQE